ncbi:hypothetical protein G6011_06887 [Alternaria panax]|uniref:Uncharacterized protein n=1 Tax=Alternaria panax TaxID=48097 RepID=A0AAD4F9L3_9PLEO|nr:hypothetical protein G6011_06887 [Alternaria panax]
MYEKLTEAELEQHVNAGNGKAFSGLSSDESKCIPHCPAFNTNNPKTPICNYNWGNCGKLAFQKEATLTGVLEDDEDAFLTREEKLFANEYVTYENLLRVKGAILA